MQSKASNAHMTAHNHPVMAAATQPHTAQTAHPPAKHSNHRPQHTKRLTPRPSLCLPLRQAEGPCITCRRACSCAWELLASLGSHLAARCADVSVSRAFFEVIGHMV